MKTISISFLLLVAFPLHLMAQESQTSTNEMKTNSKYFISSPTMSSANANHIVAPTNRSNRKPAMPIVSPNISLAKHQVPFYANPLKNRMATGPVARVAKLQDEKIIVGPPKVSPQEFNLPNNVTRPTPGNTTPASPLQLDVPQADIVTPAAPYSEPADTYANPPEPIDQQPDLMENRFQESFRTDASVEPERVSLDEFRMQQQGNFQIERPNTMRHIVDHFSPGGEPFAYPSHYRNRNLFGVDRHQCCDEWANEGNCGGLKANPGHLGIPWLGSKDSCDITKSCGCKRCAHKSRRTANRIEAGCGCGKCYK